MTGPDRIAALSQRITALTGQTLSRDEVMKVVGRAFEYQVDLDDDGQLRALLGGLASSAHGAGAAVANPQPGPPTGPAAAVPLAPAAAAPTVVAPTAPVLVPNTAAPLPAASVKAKRSAGLTGLLWADFVLVLAGFYWHWSLVTKWWGTIPNDGMFFLRPYFWSSISGYWGWRIDLLVLAIVAVTLAARRWRPLAVATGVLVLLYGLFAIYRAFTWEAFAIPLLISVLVVVSGIATIVLAVKRSTWEPPSNRPAQLAGTPVVSGVVSTALAGSPGALVQAVQTPGGFQGVALTTKYLPLNWMFSFFKPVIEVDGQPVHGVWGANGIALPPGEHRLHIHVPYLLPSRVGEVDAAVSVAPQCATELEYAAPAWIFSKGSLGAAPQPYAGMGALIAAIVVPFILGLLLILLLPVLLI